MFNVCRAMTSSAAKEYFQNGNHDYYIDGYNPPGRWGGELAKEFGIHGLLVEKEHFERLCDGYHPTTGEDLVLRRNPKRRAANDVTISASKDFSLIYLDATPEERKQLLRIFEDSCDWIMSVGERYAAGRVRIDGADYDRPTQNWAYAAFTQFESRPDKKTQIPVIQIHRHHTVMNFTRDKEEERIKALQIGIVKENADLLMPMFHNDLARRVRQLGYGIKKEKKTGIVGFAIEGVSREMVERFSPGRQGILEAKERILKAWSTPEARKKLAKELGTDDPARIDQALAKRAKALQDNLAKIVRKHKQKDLDMASLWKVWESQLTKEDRRMLAAAKGKKGFEKTNDEIVKYACDHLFYRNSVVPEKKLLLEVLRYGVGSVDMATLKDAYQRQGVLLKNGEATTREVLEEESRIIRFAREGKGTMRPLGAAKNKNPLESHANARGGQQPLSDTATLSPEQQAFRDHILSSPDRVIVGEADAGTGKSFTFARTLRDLGVPSVYLAPSATASRGVLRDEGFEEAETLARFNVDPAFREKARGGLIFLDEAPMAGISDVDRLFTFAQQLGARVVLSGDRKQHKSVTRGNLFEVLEKYAGITPARLTENYRQTHKGYKEAINRIAAGDILGGHDILERLGWVRPVDDVEKAIADEAWSYMKRNESFIVVGITHKQNDWITQELRERLKEEGVIKGEEVTVETLTPTDWTPAQKADLDQFQEDHVVQFWQNAPGFTRGQRTNVAGLRKKRPDAKHYSVYRPGSLRLAPGDIIRATAGGTTADGARIDNGDRYRFLSRAENGDLAVEKIGPKKTTPCTIGSDFKHLAYGYVDTSYKAQGQTKQRVIGAYTEASLGGVTAAQTYVTASRGRLSFKLFTDLDEKTLRNAIQKQEKRKSATEFMNEPDRNAPYRETDFSRRAYLHFRRLRENHKALREQAYGATRDIAPQREQHRGLER